MGGQEHDFTRHRGRTSVELETWKRRRVRGGHARSPWDSAFLIVVFNDQRGAGSRLLLEHDTLFHALEILYCTVRPQSECHHRESAPRQRDESKIRVCRGSLDGRAPRCLLPHRRQSRYRLRPFQRLPALAQPLQRVELRLRLEGVALGVQEARGDLGARFRAP